MLEYIKSTQMECMHDVCKQYVGCKILLKDLDLTDISNVRGTVYAVSHSRNSFKELCNARSTLAKQGESVMIVGYYNDAMCQTI